MTAKNLFNIILKILGIYFIKDILIALPSFLSVFLGLFEDGMDSGGMVFTAVLSLATIVIYCTVIYILVFKTNWVIEKCKLTNDFSEEPLALNIHRSTVVSIAVLFTGLYVVTQAIPDVVRDASQFIQYRQERRGILGSSEPFNYTWFVAHIVEIAIGIILVSYHKPIVNYIEYRRTK